MSTTVDSLIPRIGSVIDKHIQPIFKGTPRITVLVRFEDSDEADVIVTSDTDAGIQAIVSRRTTATQARAAAEVPDGYVIVPVEPTPKMVEAGRWTEYGEETSRLHKVDDEAVQSVYAYMLSAAPPAPAAEVREPLTDEQVEDLRGDANRGFCIEREDYFKAFRDAERAHGIPARLQHGSEKK